MVPDMNIKNRKMAAPDGRPIFSFFVSLFVSNYDAWGRAYKQCENVPTLYIECYLSFQQTAFQVLHENYT